MYTIWQHNQMVQHTNNVRARFCELGRGHYYSFVVAVFLVFCLGILVFLTVCCVSRKKGARRG